MKNRILRILSLIICAVMLFSLTACGEEEVAIDINEFMPDGKLAEGVIVENEKFSLSWVDEEKCVVLTDKATGSRWSTTPSEYLDTPEAEKQVRARGYLESPIFVNYKLPEEQAIATARAYTHSIKKNDIAAEKKESTITVTYMFEDADCIIPVDYTLTNKGMSISIDTNKIVEGANDVYSIDLAPYFCSTVHGREDSYIFYPSGSGAIIDIAQPIIEAASYSSPVYGRDYATAIKHELTNDKNVYLPVYGIKKGNEAVCAIITSGAEQATLSTIVYDTPTAYTTVYANFALRSGDYNFIAGVGTPDTTIYSENSLENAVFSVEFIPLSAENANYTGMAKAYQEYLYGDNNANSAVADPVYSVKFLGGLLQQRNFLGFPYKKLISLTSYTEAQNILTELSSTGVKPNVMLYGYGQSGMDVGKVAGGFKLGSAFGSKAELSAFTEYCKQNGISSYVDFNLSEFASSGAGYTTSDSAKSASRMAAFVYKVSKGAQILDKKNYDKHRLISRSKLDGIAEKLSKKISGYNIEGVSFESLSSMSYSDFGYPEYYVKNGMGAQVKGITELFKNGGYKTAASGANAYSAVLADTIFNTPLNSSKQEIFTADIPFYQMVFKGKTETVSEPVNSGISYQTKKLMAIEGGASMLFTLSSDYNSTATLSYHKDIYAAQFSGNKETMVAAAEELKDYYSQTSGQTIKDHKLLTNDVRLTTYSNGLKVYVNYSEDDYTTADGVVKASDYLIIK